MNDADIIRGLAQELLEWKGQATKLLLEVRKNQEGLKQLLARAEAAEKALKEATSPQGPTKGAANDPVA